MGAGRRSWVLQAVSSRTGDGLVGVPLQVLHMGLRKVVGSRDTHKGHLPEVLCVVVLPQASEAVLSLSHVHERRRLTVTWTDEKVDPDSSHLGPACGDL